MMSYTHALFVFILHISLLQVVVSLIFGEGINIKGRLPIVINTWEFPNATQAAWTSLQQGSNAVDAVVAGCSECEDEQCHHGVGPGGKPDESGETTLDSMIMDGQTMDVGAVGCLRRMKSAIAVARAVMKYTKHTLMVGDLATNFALSMGFTEMNLSTSYSIDLWQKWKNGRCQPNFRENVTPASDCGPYSRPSKRQSYNTLHNGDDPEADLSSKENHDTIGMIAIDASGNISAGTSTNGLNHKIPGRVGDSPIPGAGAYADNEAGASVATGNGDIMMRFLPT
ncbi:hypothetical protein FSP39_016741 [Pinctada imbricata]|uniref:N(4)-(Beta-N-acetylglucosaminyl)-L-asparaginase n=1 Tax=Pinctada imbricata TaxID=66713 RepID=A0AA89C429_PINIB|nr:hypothetical protein FSP39_016741 [Pinctada imbricata]